MICVCCQKPIRKSTVNVTIARVPTQYHHPSEYSCYAYIGDAEWPKTIADCRKLTNKKILSVRRGAQGQIAGFNTWDGVSYSARYSYFCSVNCAARYGQLAAPNWGPRHLMKARAS